jgi:hypothetical protein
MVLCKILAFAQLVHWNDDITSQILYKITEKESKTWKALYLTVDFIAN